MNNDELFSRIFSEWGFSPQDDQRRQLNKYYELLVDWNTRMNLTGITEYEQVLIKHYIDSIMIGKLVPESVRYGNKLIDIGTGAGFPGIPIKIMYPELECVLLDSLQKRVGFLNHVIDELNMSGIRAVHARAEEYVTDGNREAYDVCVSRAVADLCVLSELCLPYVKPGGYFVSYKSGHCEDEIDKARNAIMLLGGEIQDIKSFNLTQDSDSRNLIVIKKISVTPDRYPRRTARIMKNPL